MDSYVDTLGNTHPGEGIPLLPGFPALPPEKLIHGTLREAVEAKGPRYIVFAVSGTIRLKAPLDIKNPYIRISGQTAPGEGIQIRNFGIEVETHDVISGISAFVWVILKDQETSKGNLENKHMRWIWMQ